MLVFGDSLGEKYFKITNFLFSSSKVSSTMLPVEQSHKVYKYVCILVLAELCSCLLPEWVLLVLVLHYGFLTLATTDVISIFEEVFQVQSRVVGPTASAVLWGHQMRYVQELIWTISA